jgi:acylphosphatase
MVATFALVASAAIASAGVIGSQWSWVNVNIDTQTRTGLTGPVGGTGLTWNECIGTGGLTQTNLLNSNGVATTVGFTCNAGNVFEWASPELKLLTGSAYNHNMNTPMSLVISGLTPGKKYSLYLGSYVPNEQGSRNVFTTTNTTTSGSTQLIDNGGPWGKSDRWQRGVNYTRYENLLPDATNSIRLTLTSGSPNHRAHLSGFQLIQDPTAAPSPYATWLASYSFASIPGADVSLDGDPDRDLYTNMEEFLLGTDPTLADRRAGVMMTESWNGIVGMTVPELLASPKFFNQPDTTVFSPSTRPQFTSPYIATRSRAYITPTISGNYTFWLAACTSADLFFSSNDVLGKYAKQRIAAVGSDLGHGTGISYYDTFLWDRFTGQQSTVISLQAGTSYYFEIDHKNGSGVDSHTSVAWAREGGLREVLPTTVISSYTQTADDSDDDCLPDAWEQMKGLSLTDNGLSDPQRQGERGDYDADGLSNREEYLLDTHPANSDTDGDGQTDGAEVRNFGTSPVVSNVITTSLVSSLPLTGYNPATTSGTWQMFGGGLIGDTFRGHIEWSFTVPSAGWYLLDLSSRLRGTVRPAEELMVSMEVDGRALPSKTIRFTNGQADSVSSLSPWLSAGSHTLRLKVHNEIGRRTLQILGLKVLAPGGFDGDSNGQPDWVDALLTSGSAVVPIPTESPISPLFIEGSARCVGATRLTANGSAVSVVRGLGDQHWYANPPLAFNGATTLSVSLENKTLPHMVTWSRWNAMTGQGITLRVGDSLKIGGWLTANDNGNVQIQVKGQTHSIPAMSQIVSTFSQAGSFPVVVSHSGGSQTIAVVTVVSADLGTVAAFYADYIGRHIFENVPASLLVVAAPSMLVDEKLPVGNGQSVRLRASRGGVHDLAARIPGGPIVALGTVTTVTVADALKNDAAQYIGAAPDGYSIFRSPIVVTDLTPGSRVVITIFRAGVTFMDGTTAMTLSAADFVNDVAYLQFRFAPGITGGYCHYIEVYDAQNHFMGRR